MTKRARDQLGTLGTLFAIACITGLILSGSLAFISASTTAGIQQEFIGLNPVLKVQQYQTQLRDEDAQLAAAEEIFDRLLPAGGFQVEQQIRGFVQNYQHEALELRQVATPDTFGEEVAELIVGNWPSGGVVEEFAEVALSSTSAELIGVDLGSEITVHASNNEEFFVRVVGVYQPLAVESGFWEVSSGVATGAGEVGSFPVVYDEAAFAELFSSASIRLNLIANPLALDANAVDQTVNNLQRVQDALRTSTEFSGGKGMSYGGGVLDSLTAVQDALISVRAVTPVPVLLIVMLSVIGLSQLAVLLNTGRRSETVLFKSRGMSVTKLGRANWVEALCVTFPIALVGALLAIPVIALMTGTWVHWLEPLVVGVSVGLLSSIIVFFVGRQDLIAPLNRETGHDSGRLKSVVQAGLVLLTVVATGLSIWQFKIHGSAMILSPDGDVSLDWVSLLAPVLLILTGTLLALLLIGPFTLLIARVRYRRIIGYLSTVQVSRRVTIFSVSFSLIALAMASIIFAASYAGSWQETNARSQATENPSGVKLVLPTTEMWALDGYSGSNPNLGTEGISGVAALNYFGATFRQEQFDVLIVPPGLDSVVTTVSETDGRAELLEFADGQQIRGIEIPAGTTALDLELTSSRSEERYHQFPGSFWLYPTGEFAEPEPARTQFILRLSDGSGGILTVVETLTSEQIRDHFVIELPQPEQSWQLIELNVIQASENVLGNFELDWHSLTLQSPQGATEVQLGSQFERSEVYLEYRGAGGNQLNRHYATVEVMDTLPALVSQPVLDQLSVDIGDTLELQFLGNNRKYTAEILAVAPEIPGTSSTLSVVFPILDFQARSVHDGMFLLNPNQYWFALDEPDTLPHWLTEWNTNVLGSDLQLGSRVNPLVYASVITGWFGAAGILVLALTALFAVTTVLSTTRRPEIPVLRALGLSARLQANIRRSEMVLVTVMALIAGSAIGLLASWLTVPEMALSTMLNHREEIEPLFALDWVVGALYLLVFVAGLTGVIWRYVSLIRKQALDTEYREETR